MIYTAVEAKQFDAVGFEPSTSTLGVKFKARGGGKVPPRNMSTATSRSKSTTP